MIAPPPAPHYALVAQMLQQRLKQFQGQPAQGYPPRPGAGQYQPPGQFLHLPQPGIPAFPHDNGAPDWGPGGGTFTGAGVNDWNPVMDPANGGFAQPDMPRPIQHAGPPLPIPGFTPAPLNIAAAAQGQGAPDMPASVFGQMRKALPAATRSNITSHQQALIQRFMQNRTGKARAV